MCCVLCVHQCVVCCVFISVLCTEHSSVCCVYSVIINVLCTLFFCAACFVISRAVPFLSFSSPAVLAWQRFASASPLDHELEEAVPVISVLYQVERMCTYVCCRSVPLLMVLLPALLLPCTVSHGQMKMDVLRFLTSEVFTEEDIILLLLIATGDTRQRYVWRVMCIPMCIHYNFVRQFVFLL